MSSWNVYETESQEEKSQEWLESEENEEKYPLKGSSVRRIDERWRSGMEKENE